MKSLRYEILSRLSFFFVLVLSIWGVVFYLIINDEINDETDDYLQEYASKIIVFILSGDEIPKRDVLSNNTYFIKPITLEEANKLPVTRFFDEEIYIPTRQETEPARTLQTPFHDLEGKPFLLSVSIPNVEKKELRFHILLFIIILFAALFLALMAVIYEIFRQSMQPFHTILNWIKNYRIGEKTDLPDIRTNITEFHELNDIVISTTRQNEAIFEQQKQFISNASHELQTPLAACKNRLELLADSDALGEKELLEIMDIQKRLNNAIKLNKTLLFLSKIENLQFTEKNIIDFNVLIDNAATDFKEAYQYKSIELIIVNKEIFKTLINETLANSLIINLLKNAYLHNVSGGKIMIEITALQIKITNTGTAESLDKTALFSRFYQSKNRKPESTGLGLAIVHAICEQNYLSVDYDYLDGWHCFVIRK